MKILIIQLITVIIVCGLSLSSCFTEDEYKYEFERFVEQYGRTYDGEEKQTRFEYFKRNLDFITSHNSIPDRTFDVGVNNFGDWTREEYLELVGPLRSVTASPSDGFEELSNKDALPDSWNWVQKGAVTPISNQQQCGSSPYFAAVVSMEACHFLTTGNLVELSPQNLVDCPGDTGNEGCNGGLMSASFQVILSEKGIDTNSCYPYVAETGATCKFNPETPCCGSTLGSYVHVTPSEGALQVAVLKVPVAVAVDGSLETFMYYTSGVYSDSQCSTSQVDLGIAVVGYGIDSTSGMDYWLLKNAWGESWGMEGFMWLARNEGNMCGVATLASYALDCGNC